MSDYLGNLVARFSAPTAVIKPRLPSLFESSRLFESILPAEVDREVQTVAPESSLPRVDTLAVPPMTSMHADRIPGSVRSEPPSEKESSQRTPEFPEVAPVRRPLPRTEEPAFAQPAAVQSERPMEARAVVRPVFREKNEPTPAPIVAGTVPVISSPPVVPPPLPRTIRPVPRPVENVSGQIRESARLEAKIEPSDFSRRPADSRAQAVTVRPAVAPLQNLSPKLLPSVASQAPEIHVTIGRVEVRASALPVASRVRRTDSPVLNLQDYLRGRAQEGRR